MLCCDFTLRALRSTFAAGPASERFIGLQSRLPAPMVWRTHRRRNPGSPFRKRLDFVSVYLCTMDYLSACTGGQRHRNKSGHLCSVGVVLCPVLGLFANPVLLQSFAFAFNRDLK